MAEITVHPQYDTSTLNNDVAVLRLQYAYNPNGSVRSVNLSSSALSISGGESLTVMGHGLLEDNGLPPTNLHDVDVTAVGQAECNAAYGGGITSNMLCAADAGKDSCQGDSGGKRNRHFRVLKDCKEAHTSLLFWFRTYHSNKWYGPSWNRQFRNR